MAGGGQTHASIFLQGQIGFPVPIDVSDGSMTATNSVVQFNLARFGTVVLSNSDGLFRSTVFSNNVVTTGPVSSIRRTFAACSDHVNTSSQYC